MSRMAVVVHGGCGRWAPADTPRALQGVRAAVTAARRVLEQGGSALDAVCAAVVCMEDDPLFNAGTGCALNREGEAEMDASVMAGHSLACGGVAALKRVKNPVLVARRVMDDTPHVLLAGNGAQGFARRCGFGDYDPVTKERLERHHSAILAGPATSGDTVGAVALDAAGHFAAATSTGGLTLKLPGRVGDAPIPGAGNYASAGAASSATGTGELMMKTLATKWVCDAIDEGGTAARAVQRMVGRFDLVGDQSAGMIALDGKARVGIAMAGGRMPHAWYTEGDGRITARLTV
jgi:L-asparaginase / beta-aspartyl-peptidase